MARSRGLALALMLPFLAATVDAAKGGPDAFGYTWADSDDPAVDTSIPASLATPLGLGGDDAVVVVTLPFAFPFYGVNYARFYLSSNGWLSFQDPAANSYPIPGRIPSPAQPGALVAFFWDDWTLAAASPLAESGPNLAGDGHTIALRVALKSDPTTMANVTIVLWRDGCIKVVWPGLDPRLLLVSGATEIGLENAAGTIGISYMSAGLALNSANFRGDYAVAFCPSTKPFLPFVGNTLKLARKGSTVVLTAATDPLAIESFLYRDAARTARRTTRTDTGTVPSFEDTTALAASGDFFYVVTARGTTGGEQE